MKNKSLIAIGLGAALTTHFASAQSVNLSQLYSDSLDNNPALTRAALEIDSVTKQLEQVKGLYRPQVDVSVSYGALRNDWTTLTQTDGQGAEVGLSVGQNLYNSELNATKGLVNQKQALTLTHYQVALEGLQLSVAKGYFDALKAQENLTQVEATKKAIGEHLSQMQHRFANGLVPENDVKETQAQYDLATTSAIFAQNQVEKALDYLYELTGHSYTKVTPLAAQLPELSIPKPYGVSQWEEQAQKTNPQMQIQQHLVTLSREQIALAEAGHMPSLGLVAEYRYAFAAQSRLKPMGTSGGSFDNLDNNATVFAGVAMTLPVYKGGSTTSKVEQASIQYEQARQLQEQTWREVTRDIRSTEKDLLALKSAHSAYQQAVISAEAALQATEQGLELGSRTIVDVLNATKQLYGARQALTESHIDFLFALLHLRFLVGELSAEDLVAMNTLLAV